MHISYSSLPSLEQQTVSWLVLMDFIYWLTGVCWKYWLLRLRMDEWANSLKELEMLLPATSGGSVTVCALSQRMCRLFVERTRQNILGTYLLFTQPHITLALAVMTMVVERERHTYEDKSCRDNRILCFIRPILVSLVSVYGGYCWCPNISWVSTYRDRGQYWYSTSP